MSDGVRVVTGTSSFGRREEELCRDVLDASMLGSGRVIGTVVMVLPWRGLTAIEGFDVVARWLVTALAGGTCSSLVGLFFCSLVWAGVGSWELLVAVGVTDRCGNRVVGAR